jgi:AraC family transcriptional regulator of adaptative response / DNA-3-methyladenine glycosylase II
MILDPEACYQAMLTHDARFDGAFFVGVSTTRIYCRPVCRVKTPRRESCTFYPSAAAAEVAGFRPCLRCRPELAPGSAPVDAVSRLAVAASGRIEDGALTDGSVADLAEELGVSERHLRRVIHAELGVSPIQLAQTQRLLLAKRLLTDTALPIGEVAFASGFSSLTRFNTLFRERYRLSPTQIRKSRAAAPAETLLCELAYRPPLAWDSLLAFLGARASCGVEQVEGRRYLRTVVLGKRRGWIAAEPSASRHTIRVEVSAALAPTLLPLLARTRRLFDLNAEPQRIADRLGPLAAANPGLRVPGAFDGFEIAVRAILGQQVSVRAATTLAGRFSAALGEPVETPFEGLTHATPTAERVAEATESELAALGILPSRARSILALAGAVVGGRLALDPAADAEVTMARLIELPGVGEWTAQYIGMRALAWPDAFPHTDLAIRKAMNETRPKPMLETAEAWRPWRSYAAMHLWESLGTAATAAEPGT